MKLALIGTYPPTRCGIATFTSDVSASLLGAGIDVEIVRVLPDGSGRLPALSSDPVGAFVLADRACYADVARLVNSGGFDIVLIEHEFGIFGGVSGEHILDLTSRLDVPYVVTFHTVLPKFSDAEARVMHGLCSEAAAVTVFTSTARELMLAQRLVALSKVRIIAHGAPVEMYSPNPDGKAVRRSLGLPAAARVASTFGLLSEGKGIEIAIAAIAALPAELSDVIYVVAGRTHPGVVRRQGEVYRQRLEQLTEQLGMSERVVFIDRFMDVKEIADLLSISDVFVTPYRGVNQIVSGALTFALAAGRPVVSTPYRYACDMLADGAGILVPFDDVAALTRGIERLLVEPERSGALTAARRAANGLSWPAIGEKIADVLREVTRQPQIHLAPSPSVTAQRESTEPSARHIRMLCDDTAMLQHSDHSVPRTEEGYCVDDAARVLPVLCDLVCVGEPSADWEVLLGRTLSFVRSAALDSPPGAMRNFLSWDRKWLDDPHQGDHVGRAIWGLGEVVGRSGKYVEEASTLLEQLVSGIDDTAPIRTVAYATLGLVAAGQRAPLLHLRRLHGIVGRWSLLDDPNWRWYEPRLTYDNARLAHTQICLGDTVNDDSMVRTGLEALAWLDKLCWQGTHYRFPGHRGLSLGEDIGASGDEQPLEAAAMADAHFAAWVASGDSSRRASVDRCWWWFRGGNRVGVAVGDPRTGACFDAVTTAGVNRNCGAESAIAFNRCWATHEACAIATVDAARSQQVPS